MSRERELLRKLLDTIAFRDDMHCLDSLTCDIEELLAEQEPEQEEQEPVAWMCNLLGDVVTDKPADNNGYTALYKSPKGVGNHMIKYTAIVSFKVEIEAFNEDDAAYIANQALPTQFKYANSKGGSGIYLSGLAPVIYEEDRVKHKMVTV
jgi:hypothetical protein